MVSVSRRLLRRRNHAVFFISTGRCGTQWLADELPREYAGEAVVEHEPLEDQYAPRQFYRDYQDPGRAGRLPAVAAHLERIERELRRGIYIETGWPAFATIPHLAERFEGRLRVVHLVRHPVPTAFSLARLGVYSEHRHFGDFFAENAVVTPAWERLIQPPPARPWDSLADYEKALFMWTEVSLYADELRERLPGVPMTRVRWEDLTDVGSEELRRLVDFMGLPWRPGLAAARAVKVDKFTQLPRDAGAPAPWEKVLDQPACVDRLRTYGYDLEGLSDASLAARYSSRVIPTVPPPAPLK